MKKIIFFSATALILLLLTVSGVTVNAQEAVTAATTTTDVELSVTYGQTEARSMLALINNFRTGDETWYWNSSNTEKIQVSGLKPLTYSYELEKIAMQRAAEIALSFSHTRPNGQSTFSLGNFYGENIAGGYSTVKSVMEGWKETDFGYSGQGHRRNMLSSSFTHVGVGHAYANGYHYWVQDFGIGSSVGTETSANNAATVVVISVADGDVISFAINDDSISLKVNESRSVSSLSGKLTMTESWPYGATVTVRPSWTVENSSIATLQNGTLTGRAPGNTAIKTTLFSKSVSVGVTVTCSNHIWDTWKTTKEATCTQAGSRTHKCTLCGTEETEKINAQGHDYKKTVTAATCTAKGYTTYTCSRCKDTYKDNYTDKKPHTWGNWTVTKAATCTANGTRSHSCTVCGTVETESVAKISHNYVNGKCTVCGDVLPNSDTTVVTSPVETDPPVTDPPATDPVETAPTETDTTVTDTVETDPIETDPPVTEPVETDLTETVPNVTDTSKDDSTETDPTESAPIGTDQTGAASEPDDTLPTNDTDAQDESDNLVRIIIAIVGAVIAAAATVFIVLFIKRRRNGQK